MNFVGSNKILFHKLSPIIFAVLVGCGKLFSVLKGKFTLYLKCIYYRDYSMAGIIIH